MTSLQHAYNKAIADKVVEVMWNPTIFNNFYYGHTPAIWADEVENKCLGIIANNKLLED